MAASGRTKTLLDITASALMCCAALVVLYRFSQPASKTASRILPIYTVGERFEGASLLGGDNSHSTLVVWVRSTCPFCSESMEFYKRLASGPRRAKLVVMGAEPSGVLEAYVASYGLQPDRVVSWPKGMAKLPVTPVLLLVGNNSIVQGLWRGKLARAHEEAVAAALR